MQILFVFDQVFCSPFSYVLCRGLKFPMLLRTYFDLIWLKNLHFKITQKGKIKKLNKIKKKSDRPTLLFHTYVTGTTHIFLAKFTVQENEKQEQIF